MKYLQSIFFAGQTFGPNNDLSLEILSIDEGLEVEYKIFFYKSFLHKIFSQM